MTWDLLNKEIPPELEYSSRLMQAVLGAGKSQISSSYTKERKLFELLLISGNSPVDRKLLYTAYFEDYDPEKPNPIPAWKQMMAVFNQSYGISMLLEVDKIIKENGIDKAIEFVKSKK